MKLEKVACLGPLGTFTHEAAVKKFPHAEIDLCNDIEEVFEAVYNRRVEHGILPVKNTIAGLVDQAFHLLVQQGDKPRVKISGDIVHPIEMFLYGIPGCEISRIQYIHTKDAAWKQCQNWIKKKIPKAQFVSSSSTALGVKEIREINSPERVAIASELAGTIYGMTPLASGIEDIRGNETRFYTLTHKPVTLTNKTKGLLAIALHDKMGAIAETLAEFPAHSIDIRNIDTIPIRGQNLFPWKDWFLVEIEFSDFVGMERAVEKIKGKKDQVMAVRELGYFGRVTRPIRASELAERASGKPRKDDSSGEKGIGKIEQLILAGESKDVEFKSTLRWDLREKEVKDHVEFSVVKTIAGFMNGSGGTLVIGVADNAETVGLQEDYKTLPKADKDGFELYLRSKLDQHINKSLHVLVDISFYSRNSKDICVVEVKESSEAVWLNYKEQKEVLYVRTGNRTVPYTPKVAAEYLQLRNKTKK